MIPYEHRRVAISAFVGTLLLILLFPFGTQVNNTFGNSGLWGYLIAFGCALLFTKVWIMFKTGSHIGAIRSALLVMAACMDGVIVCMLMSWRA